MSQKKLPNILPDKWVKSIAVGGNLHATAISAANLIENARKLHQLTAYETLALGEALMAGLLLASTCKNGERVSLSVKGDLFLKQTVIDANHSGSVRGFVISREAPKVEENGMGPWQNGLLSVVRLKINEKEPYVGTVPNVTGHLAKDLTFYLLQSEQIPSAVGLAVNLAEDGSVESAGAFLIQVMPGANQDEIKMLEDNIHHFHSFASQIAKDSNPTKLLGQLLDNMTFTLLEEKPLQFECNCSEERVSRALKLLGPAELQAMVDEDGGAEIGCDFCRKKYSFSREKLTELIEMISPK